MRRTLFLLMVIVTSQAFALGGDVQENLTHSAFSAESANDACAAAATRLKSNVQLMGWRILSKGNVPCDCKQLDDGWNCTITALVEKPDDDASYRN